MQSAVAIKESDANEHLLLNTFLPATDEGISTTF